MSQSRFFPNLIINVTNDDRLAQQVHFLINRGKFGIYHLGSHDLIQHEELIKEIIKRLGKLSSSFEKGIYHQ